MNNLTKSHHISALLEEIIKIASAIKIVGV